mgnify:FL=1
MTDTRAKSWQAVQDEVLRRIHTREWKPGELIPNEVDLAEEFGCARATVNRALRELAETGLLDRRRRAGTRVALNPVRKAVLEIPVTRLEIEACGARYSHVPLSRQHALPPPGIRGPLGLEAGIRLLHLEAVHMADGRPYAYEDRWINEAAVPAIRDVDFEQISANEWLVHNAPYTAGDFTFTAASAGPREAEVLGCAPGAALFIVERTTRYGETPITAVRLAFPPGYRLQTRA